MTVDTNNLFYAAETVLDSATIESKVAQSREVIARWQSKELNLDASINLKRKMSFRHPDKPRLVHPSKLPNRSVAAKEGLIAFVHAIAHIEFSAINLAWDAIYRYRTLPSAYYRDWLKVAEEETAHFDMLNKRLQEMGSSYGAFDAHGGLWDLAEKTAHNFIHRMAVVPRGLEARGLDVTPGMIQRLRSVGDHRTVELLEIIYQDEIGHVAIGDRWFRYGCEKQNLDPESTYRDVVKHYTQSHIKGPFNVDARVQAGFTLEELKRLEEETL